MSKSVEELKAELAALESNTPEDQPKPQTEEEEEDVHEILRKIYDDILKAAPETTPKPIPEPTIKPVADVAASDEARRMRNLAPAPRTRTEETQEEWEARLDEYFNPLIERARQAARQEKIGDETPLI